MAAVFQSAQDQFRQVADLSSEEENDFKITSLTLLRQVIDGLQKKQEARRGMVYMKRLEPFLKSMEQYGKVIEVFLNVSDVLAFVWVCYRIVIVSTSSISLQVSC